MDSLIVIKFVNQAVCLAGVITLVKHEMFSLMMHTDVESDLSFCLS